MNERIKTLRKTLGLTQQQFADNLKIARGNIAAYEVGKNLPSDAAISLICREFNVNESWLRDGSGTMFKSSDMNRNNLTSKRIKTLRKTLGLTQQDFADKLGIKRAAISNYEIGRNAPIDAVISLICREFNVNETWLRDGSGDMFKSSNNMPLQHGTYCTVEDFYNVPGYIRAELINGQIVHVAAPSSMHQIISSELHFAINSYIKSTGSRCRVLTAPIGVQLRHGDDTVLQPDISVICDTDKLTGNGCIGAPDWIIEIVSPSNSSHDYITKLSIYHDSGVREYWTVDAQNNEIHVYNMGSGAFTTKTYSFNDTIKAGIYEDLYIDFSSLDIGI